MSDESHPAAPQVRPVIARLPAYIPGRRPRPRAGGPTYKLSSNENPYPPLPAVLGAAFEAVGRMNRYPDMACADLYAALGERLGVPVERLAAGTGSVAVLYHLLQAFCETGDEVIYGWRSFEAYPIAVSVTGAVAVPVPLDDQGRHDLDAMADAVTDRTKVVVVCSPNNPTGPAVGREELDAFLRRVPPHVLVVLDEAYREFARPAAGQDPVDGVQLVLDHVNVVSLRTFAKAYGLAGLRVGYAVASPAVAAAVRACALPFGVSGVAQAAAVAALEYEDELLGRVEQVVAERARVVETLVGQGWVLPEAQGNFVWLPLLDRATAFAAAAEESGVSVRLFAGDGVRVTVAEPAANDLFLEVAARFAAGSDAGSGA